MNKQTIRKEYLAIRKNIPDKHEKSLKIINKIIEMPIYKESKNIALYYNLPSEVETIELIKYSIENHKNVYLPVVLDEHYMEFYQITDINKVTKNKLGIMEPTKTYHLDKTKLELIVVPGISFDKRKNRIGFGASYYDNFLSKLNNTYKIGICFNEQILKKEYIETESNDIQMDIVITEENSYK